MEKKSRLGVLQVNANEKKGAFKPAEKQGERMNPPIIVGLRKAENLSSKGALEG